MDGLVELNQVLIIAATNRPDIIDTALLRPGRFDRIIYVDIPDKEARKKILGVHTKDMPMAENIDIDKISNETEGYVGADLEAVCREAAMLALREDKKAEKVELKHFNEAIQKVRPSVNKEVQKMYRNLADNFKQNATKQIIEERPTYFG